MNAVAARYGVVAGATATPERQMAVLFETARTRIRSGIQDLESGRGMEGAASLQSASKIVSAFIGWLKPAVAPDLCRNLTRVYVFVSKRLSAAAMKQNVTMAREAERVFAPVADAFVEAANRVGGRR